jgi:hypothetical protein
MFHTIPPARFEPASRFGSDVMKQAAIVRKTIITPAATVVVPPAPSKRATVLSIGIVVLLAIVFWACDGFLLIRIRAIASDAFTKSPSNPMLSVDDLDALDAYSPRRLSQCLWAPSVQMRTVVCLAIGRRQTWKESEAWVGVLPALLKVLRESDDRELQSTIMQPLLSMKFVPPEDANEVYKFADEQLSAKESSWSICAHLLGVTADSLPDQRSNVLQAFERSLVNPVAQFESTRRLARLAPNSPEAATAVRAYTQSYAPSRGVTGLSTEARAIILRQPALIDELLDGTTNQRLAVLAMATNDLMYITAPLKDEATDVRRPDWLTWERLRRMREIALGMIKQTNDRDLSENPDALYSFLRYWRDGPEVLFQLAKSSTGKQRVLALRYAAYGAYLRPKPGVQQFFSSNMSDLAQWLGDDAETRRSILYFLWHPEQAEWLKRQSKETKDALLAACRRTLDQSTSDDDFVCVSLMAGLLDEFDAADADRIAAAIERGLLVLKQGYERTGFKPQGAIHELHRRLFDHLALFESRPAVERAVKLRRSLEAEGIVRTAQ